jgi:hypothetical protein
VPFSTLPEFADLFGSATAPFSLPASGVPLGASPEAILARDYNLDIGDCVSRSWTLVKANFWPVVGISLLIYIVIGVINQIPSLFTRPIVTGMLENHRFSVPGSLIVAGILVAASPVYTVFVGGLFRYYLKLIRGQNATIADAFSGFQFLGQLILLGLVMTLLIWIGIFFCFLPGLYLSVAWYFAVPLVVDRGMGFWDAMELSRKVVNKHWFVVFALLVVVGLLSLAGAIACCVGVFVTAPIGWVALMYAYDDIFGPPPA